MLRTHFGRLPPQHAWWSAPPPGREPAPWHTALALSPFVAIWTLPQTIVGLLWAVVEALRGTPLRLYRFSWFVFLVVPVAPARARGVSMGMVVLADHPEILKHEFCHLFSGLWLSWLYLPVYGAEYLFFGHERSWHERRTVRFERELRLTWRRWL